MEIVVSWMVTDRQVISPGTIGLTAFSGNLSLRGRRSAGLALF
jgi:hypothetical protein